MRLTVFLIISYSILMSSCKVKQQQVSHRNGVTPICGGVDVDDIFSKLPQPNEVFPYPIEDTNMVYIDIEVYNTIYNVTNPLPLTRVKMFTITQQYIVDTIFSYGYYSNKLLANKYDIEICSVYDDYCLRDTLEFQEGSYNQLFFRLNYVPEKHYEKFYFSDSLGLKNAILHNVNVHKREPEWLK